MDDHDPLFSHCWRMLSAVFYHIAFLQRFTSAFYLIWPMMALGCFLISWLFHIGFFTHLPAIIRVLLLTFSAVCLLLFAGVEGMILKGAIQTPPAGLDYVIVLGAHVRSTGPSHALILRLDRAYDYASENSDTLLIVSGGKGSNEPCTEASAMRDYLLKKGLPESRFLGKDQSVNTRGKPDFFQDISP